MPVHSPLPAGSPVTFSAFSQLFAGSPPSGTLTSTFTNATSVHGAAALHARSTTARDDHHRRAMTSLSAHSVVQSRARADRRGRGRTGRCLRGAAPVFECKVGELQLGRRVAPDDPQCISRSVCVRHDVHKANPRHQSTNSRILPNRLIAMQWRRELRLLQVSPQHR